MIKQYGKIPEEERLEQSIVAREIVKTIREYGVSQYQILKIIYLLSMELEDRALSDDFVTIAKSVIDSEESDNITSEDEKNKIIMR